MPTCPLKSIKIDEKKKILEILELLEKMTLEEYKEEQKFYG